MFFDVKSIAVKAYGGGRYSAARRLLLPRRQKTRGRFYLFLAYDVESGSAHWDYRPGKDSRQVGRFMQRVRQWYPEGELWIALDQDRPHPRISQQTRRRMRELRLRWISLPKGCPDDNPVEAIFSGVHAKVLESSNDPDVRTTRRRLGAYLRARNRRPDRWIEIPYLPDSHKH